MPDSIHEQALDLAAGNTAYRLARMLIANKQENKRLRKAMTNRNRKIKHQAKEVKRLRKSEEAYSEALSAMMSAYLDEVLGLTKLKEELDGKL